MPYKYHKSKKRISSLVLTIALIAFILICSFQKGLAEWYIQSIYPIVASALSFISALIPFSVYDTFIALYVLAFMASIVFVILGKLKVLKWMKYFLSSAVFIIVWFYMSWGISYFRSDFYERTGTSKLAFDSTNFKLFLSDYIEQLNTSYIPQCNINIKEVDKDIENSYKELSESLAIKYPCGKRKTKHMIFERWITKSGISGYFGPFFNEVHVNFFALPIDLPFTIAHEKAHQFGVASEAECNLYAYIVCTKSNNKQVQYSAYLAIMGYVLNNTRKLLPNEFNEFRSKINPAIIADYNKSVEHWRGDISPKVSEAQRKVYNAYLKTNKVASGVENYSEMVELLVSWHGNKFLQK